MDAHPFERDDVTFLSGAARCAAWLYRPRDAAAAAGPIVVLGHGLGAIKEMRLDAYAARFAAAGYRALVFDYRHFGASEGTPRQLLDIDRQLADWRAAIACARGLPGVDPRRVALFGSSFGGGHAIVAAARDPAVAAVLVQCPFTSGVASTRALGAASLARIALPVLRDLVAAWRGGAPVTIKLGGPPGSAALMSAPDVIPGYLGLIPRGMPFTNRVAARVAPRILLHHPGRLTGEVRCPIFFAVCDEDSVAPAGPTLRHARRAPRGEIARYPIGHFAIYQGAAFERAVADQLAFLRRHLPPA